MKDNSNVDQAIDNQKKDKAFQVFKPIKKQSANLNFSGHPSELMELLKKNPVEQQSFKLQPSIINVAAFKEVEKPSISEFTTHINSGFKGRKPKALKKVNKTDAKKSEKTVSKFEVVNPTESCFKVESENKKIINEEDDEDSEVRKQLKAHQFDSEAEDVTDYAPIKINSKTDLCFIDKSHATLLNKRISKNSKKMYDLIGFIKNRENEINDVKTYACKYCPKVFARRAALGGHTAKNHPHQSDSYRIRQESLKNRKIERERFDYFKAIENK